MSPEDLLCSKLRELATHGRQLIAIVGPPGAGKSTLSHSICEKLNESSPGDAAILPMDGFHFDDGILRERGVLNRKGAPFTFDVGGMKSILQRLKSNQEEEVAVPVFDRSIEISRGSARIISKSTPIILVEGNYLLLEEEPWSNLGEFFDYTVMIETPLREIEDRMIERWLKHGFSAEDAATRIQENDLSNVNIVTEHSRKADFILTQATTP